MSLHKNLIYLAYIVIAYCFIGLVRADSEPLTESHTDQLRRVNNMSLHDILQTTVVRYPDFQVLQAKKIDIDAKEKYANGLLPRAPAIGLSHQNDALTTQRTQKEWEFALDLPIWMVNQKSARKQLAQDSANAYESAQISLQLVVAGMLRDALWNIAMAENQVVLANYRADMADRLLNDVQKRVKAGDLPASDTLLAKNEALSAQAMQLNAETELRHASYRYSLLTGNDHMPANYDEELSTKQFNELHPMLNEAKQKLLLADDEKSLVIVERKTNPTLSLNARNQRDPFDNQVNNSLGFRIQIPLESEVQSAPLIANAEMNIARAQSELLRLRYALENAYHEAQHNLSVARAALVLSEQQQSNSQQSLKLARKAFSLGEMDLINLLRIQSIAFEAERLYQQNVLQVKWSISRYNQAVGELP